jgi:hypothetical protein
MKTKITAPTALISLEYIGRDMKIKSTRLRRFLGKSIKVNKKINYYDYYFDLIRRLLYQSRIERDYKFVNYNKIHLKKKIIESAPLSNIC